MHLAESDYLEEVEDTRRGRSKHEAEEDQREANEELLKQVDAHFLASFWAEPAPRWPRSGFCSRELFCLRLWPTWQCCNVAMLRSQDGDVELNLGVPLPSSDVCGQRCGAPLGWSDSMCSTLAVESGDLSHWICHDQIAVPIRAETAKTANETGHVVIGGDERMVSPTILVPGGRRAPSRGTKRRKA